MNQLILGISGKKSGGKTTMANFLIGNEMCNRTNEQGVPITHNFFITEKGRLYISDLYGDVEYDGELDVFRQTPVMEDFLNEHIYPWIKVYSFADLLKKEVCMKILGLTYEQCFGSDDQKNELTHLKWENMPDVNVAIEEKSGPMTAREVMQYVGTNVFRKMYNNVWVDATIKLIQSEGVPFVVIPDVRFPNEVEGLKNAGGKVIRLTRDPNNGADQHSSEIALDEDKYDWANFDAVIDNREMSIGEQNEATMKVFEEFGWVQPINQEEVVN